MPELKESPSYEINTQKAARYNKKQFTADKYNLDILHIYASLNKQILPQDGKGRAEFVRELQMFLKSNGYKIGKTDKVDGMFGKFTRDSAEQYLKDKLGLDRLIIIANAELIRRGKRPELTYREKKHYKLRGMVPVKPSILKEGATPLKVVTKISKTRGKVVGELSEGSFKFYYKIGDTEMTATLKGAINFSEHNRPEDAILAALNKRTVQVVSGNVGDVRRACRGTSIYRATNIDTSKAKKIPIVDISDRKRKKNI